MAELGGSVDAIVVRGEVIVGIDGISFFFNDTAATEIYTLALHDALPISATRAKRIEKTAILAAQNMKIPGT